MTVLMLPSYVRQVVDGLKAELALQDSGKKAITFKDLARLKKYIDINRASVKTLQDKDRELDLQVSLHGFRPGRIPRQVLTS